MRPFLWIIIIGCLLLVLSRTKSSYEVKNCPADVLAQGSGKFVTTDPGPSPTPSSSGGSPIVTTPPCTVGGWSDWGSCSNQCGTGTQTRSRTVTDNGAHDCPTTTDSQSCTSTSGCNCPPGQTLGTNGCVDCPDGTFKSSTGNQACTPYSQIACGANNSVVPGTKTTDKSCRYATCDTNSYRSADGTRCIRCPTGSKVGGYGYVGTSVDDCMCTGKNRLNASKTACEPCPTPPAGYRFASLVTDGICDLIRSGFEYGSRAEGQTCNIRSDCADSDYHGCINGICTYIND